MQPGSSSPAGPKELQCLAKANLLAKSRVVVGIILIKHSSCDKGFYPFHVSCRSREGRPTVQQGLKQAVVEKCCSESIGHGNLEVLPSVKQGRWWD